MAAVDAPSVVAITRPFAVEDRLDIAGGRVVAAPSERREREFTASAGATSKTSFDRLARDLGHRYPPALSFPLQGRGQLVWKADGGALHTRILAPPEASSDRARLLVGRPQRSAAVRRAAHHRRARAGRRLDLGRLHSRAGHLERVVGATVEVPVAVGVDQPSQPEPTVTGLLDSAILTINGNIT